MVDKSMVKQISTRDLQMLQHAVYPNLQTWQGTGMNPLHAFLQIQMRPFRTHEATVQR